MLKCSHRESILHSTYQYLMKGWIYISCGSLQLHPDLSRIAVSLEISEN